MIGIFSTKFISAIYERAKERKNCKIQNYKLAKRMHKKTKRNNIENDFFFVARRTMRALLNKQKFMIIIYAHVNKKNPSKRRQTKKKTLILFVHEIVCKFSFFFRLSILFDDSYFFLIWIYLFFSILCLRALNQCTIHCFKYEKKWKEKTENTLLISKWYKQEKATMI